MDQDRISDWASTSRVSQVPDKSITLGALPDVHVQTRVRSTTYTWSFRNAGKLIANVTVEGGFHPVAQLQSFVVADAYAGQGLTCQTWGYVEEALMGYGFEDVQYDAARNVTDEQLRGSMGAFYAGQGVDLEGVDRTTGLLCVPADRWTVQDSGCTPRQHALSVQFSKLNQIPIAEGSPGCELSVRSVSSGVCAHATCQYLWLRNLLRILLRSQSGTSRTSPGSQWMRQLPRVTDSLEGEERKRSARVSRASDEREGSRGASSGDASGSPSQEPHKRNVNLLRKRRSCDAAEIDWADAKDGPSRATYPTHHLTRARTPSTSSPIGTKSATCDINRDLPGESRDLVSIRRGLHHNLIPTEISDR